MTPEKVSLITVHVTSAYHCTLFYFIFRTFILIKMAQHSHTLLKRKKSLEIIFSAWQQRRFRRNPCTRSLSIAAFHFGCQLEDNTALFSAILSLSECDRPGLWRLYEHTEPIRYEAQAAFTLYFHISTKKGAFCKQSSYQSQLVSLSTQPLARFSLLR